MTTLRYVARLFSANSPIFSFFTGVSKCATEMPCSAPDVLRRMYRLIVFECTLISPIMS